MAVRGGPLGAVGEQIDLRQGHHEAEHPGAEEVAERLGEHPIQRRAVAAMHAMDAGVIDGVHHHADQRQRLERREEAAEVEPVLGRANPVVVVSQTQDARAHDQADGDVQPGFDDATRGVEQAHQRPGHDARDQHLPGRLDPQVHQPPPPVHVLGHVGFAGEGVEVEHEQRHEVNDEHTEHP